MHNHFTDDDSFIHFIADFKNFYKLIYFLLKDNCFTEFYSFLSNLKMNQP